jgi:O-antigen biosynthesis protein
MTDGNFRVLLPAQSLEFTGERMTTAVDGVTAFEHFHRYCLARDLCPGLDVLDVASGEGYGSAILAGVARSVVGVEIDAGTVGHAQETYRIDTLRFIQGSAIDLPLEDACVDVVVSFETLEHVRQHDQFMHEVKRVLRPGGILIVSTPDRSVYSGRLESFNQYHLLELIETEFEALLRTHFLQVVIFHQRAILGSLIAAKQNEGPWRTYERRAPEYIEASNGLSRSPYLIGVVSDGDPPHVGSSAYFDQRGVGETVSAFMRAPSLEALATERERERDSLRAALSDAESRAAERERERDSLRAALSDAESRARDRDSLRAALAAEEARARELASYRVSWLKILRVKTRRYRRAMFGGLRSGSAD